MKEYTDNGVPYTWELAGSQGAAFILFPEPSHTHEDVKKAKAWLRYQHDVVSLRIADEDDRDDLYKREIFAVQATKPLRWYQINQDEKLIRKYRLAGKPAAAYVQEQVLPNIAAVEAANIEKYGNDIQGR